MTLSIKFSQKNLENWQFWKLHFFWVGHFEIFFKKIFFFFGLILTKTHQSLLVCEEFSKFWWLPWFPVKNQSPKTFQPAVYVPKDEACKRLFFFSCTWSLSLLFVSCVIIFSGKSFVWTLTNSKHEIVFLKVFQKVCKRKKIAFTNQPSVTQCLNKKTNISSRFRTRPQFLQSAYFDTYLLEVLRGTTNQT